MIVQIICIFANLFRILFPAEKRDTHFVLKISTTKKSYSVAATHKREKFKKFETQFPVQIRDSQLEIKDKQLFFEKFKE